VIPARIAVALVVGAGVLLGPGRPATAATATEPIPVFAYYYIWFNASSWNRAKTDYPAIGRYSSDEASVMRSHVEWAKAAGITGFIVSWKSTPTLNRRLETLVRIADDVGFDLAVIYQGLDFYRRPLPVSTVRSDLRFFASRFGDDPAFSTTFGRPLVIWSGTWEFSPGQVASVTDVVGDRLQVLASERTAEDYQRVASSVAGDAYYWSSVNPSTYPGYPQKLAEMGRAVHDHGGLWIAPAAPGFDARLVGGTTVVPRNGGSTLRTELSAAFRSNPDAVGLISWNEFSENSQIEPSVRFGSTYLNVLADVLEAPPTSIPDFESSAPAGPGSGIASWMAIAGLVAITLGSVIAIVRRNKRGLGEVKI
jgi:glycosyl hydrolase family 99